MNKAKCSAAGKALAECRWGKSGGKKKKKAAAKPKSSAPPRRSRRLAGVTARQPEPKKKPPRKAPKKKAPKRSAASKKIENILVPGLNPARGDMSSFIEQQRRLYG